MIGNLCSLEKWMSVHPYLLISSSQLLKKWLNFFIFWNFYNVYGCVHHPKRSKVLCGSLQEGLSCFTHNSLRSAERNQTEENATLAQNKSKICPTLVSKHCHKWWSEVKLAVLTLLSWASAYSSVSKPETSWDAWKDSLHCPPLHSWAITKQKWRYHVFLLKGELRPPPKLAIDPSVRTLGCISPFHIFNTSHCLVFNPLLSHRK